MEIRDRKSKLVFQASNDKSYRCVRFEAVEISKEHK
jgi:hypothetical protein